MHSRVEWTWSEPRVEALRRRLAEVRTPHELAAINAQILAATGDREAARMTLEKYIQRHARDMATNGHAFFEVVVAALTAAQFVVAQQVITKTLRLRWAISIQLAEDDQSRHAALVRWIAGPLRSTFLFSPRLFNEDFTIGVFSLWVRLLPLFDRYHETLPMRAGQTDLSLWDCGLAPGLSFSDHERSRYLIPDPEFMSKKGYAEARTCIERASVPWEARSPVALWRGATTGTLTKGWRSLQRVKLCEIAGESAGAIDAGITAIVQMRDPRWVEEIRSSGLMRQSIPYFEFGRHKYQIDIDGNSNAWAGLFCKLLTGSPVLKVASPQSYRQWYYDRLVPWVNYVPVRSDMSDLLEKVRWLRDHDERAREIGLRGFELAQSMTFDAETSAAVVRIRAAFAYFAGRAEITAYFGSGCDGNELLTTGWAAAAANGVPTLDAASGQIELAPLGSCDYRLELQVSVSVDVPQRLTVIVNDEIVLETRLRGAMRLRCHLRHQLVMTQPRLRVTLDHAADHLAPDQSQARAGMDLTLHALWLTPCP